MDKRVIVFSLMVLAILGFSFAATSATSNQGEYYYLINVSNVSFLPSTIYAGGTVSLAVDVTNKATTYSITDLNASIALGNQFEPIEPISTISSILPNSTKTLIFSFKVKPDTIEGFYPATITFNYDRNGLPLYNSVESRTETSTITIPVSKTEKNIDITVNPSVINPSSQTEITFTLKNLGQTPISNISFSFDEASNLILPVGSDNKRYVSYIGANSSENIKYLVAADPNIVTGIYPITTTVTFSDQNGLRTQTSQIGVIVGGGTDFEVSAEETTNTLSLSIANIGSNNAGAVVVKVLSSGSSTVTGSNSSILGNLNKGDFTIASYQTQSNAINATGSQFVGRRGGTDNNTTTNAPTSNPREILIQIDYTDTTGARQSVQKTITAGLSASSASGTTSTSTTGFSGRQRGTDATIPIVLFVLLIGISAIINKIKVKKSWKTFGIISIIVAIIFAIVVLFFSSGLIPAIVAGIIGIILFGLFFKTTKIENIIERTNSKPVRK